MKDLQASAGVCSIQRVDATAESMRAATAVPSIADRRTVGNLQIYRALSQPLLPVTSSHTHSLTLNVAVVAAQAAAVPQHAVKQQRCCFLAAVPTSAAASGSDAAEPNIQQQSQPQADALWSDEDIYEAFDLHSADSISTNGSTAACPEQLLQALPAAGLQQAPQHAHAHQLQQEAPQQQHMASLPQHSRHQRRFNQQLTTAVHQHQQQQSGLQQLQPVVRSFSQVHLLQRIAGVTSWADAAAVLQEQHMNLQAEHVALLWGQLTPKLLAQQQAAADRARRTATLQQHQQQWGTQPHQQQDALPQQLQQQLQVQRAVLQQLCALTGKLAISMGPSALTAAMQGLAAAAAAGKVAVAPAAGAAAADAGIVPGAGVAATAVPCAAAGGPMGVLQVDRQLLHGLQQQLVVVAGVCSPQQLTACLTAKQQLSWCDHSQSAAVSSSSSSSSAGQGSDCSLGPCQFCWSVLQEASKGQLGSLLQSGGLTSFAAAQLLHVLASCTASYAGQTAASQQQQQEEQQLQQQQHAGLDVTLYAGGTLVQQLAARACLVLTQQGPAPIAVSDAALGAAVCSLQALALLQYMPDPDYLEQLLADLQPQSASGQLGAQQQLAVLQACCDLGVEPWPEWLQDCYDSLTNKLQDLQPQQLLQLVDVLRGITNLQASQALLHQVAKMTAVHSSRYSLQQLAGLPAGLKQLGFRPQPYWLKDYLAASLVLLTAQQQRQQQQQQGQQVQGASAAVLAELLAGVGWLSAAAPPAAWLKAMEHALLAAAANSAQLPQQQQLHVEPHQEQLLYSPQGVDLKQGRSGTLPATCAAVVAGVLAQWDHTPCIQLQQMLADSLQDNTTGPGSGGPGPRHSSSTRVAIAPVAEAAPAAPAGAAASRQVDGAAMKGSSSTTSSSSSSRDVAPLQLDLHAVNSDNSVLVLGSNDVDDLWEAEVLGIASGLGDVEQVDQQQHQQEEGHASSAGLVQLARLSSAAGRPLGKSWYRAKLLQLVKGHTRHKHAGNAPALAVL